MINKPDIHLHTVEGTFLCASIPHGWGNGYIGVTKEHPWFGKHYNDIKCDVHGGLTYSSHGKPGEQEDNSPNDIWWIGFDTFHAMDNAQNCDKKFVLRQVKKLYQQAAQAYISHIEGKD